MVLKYEKPNNYKKKNLIKKRKAECNYYYYLVYCV